MADQSSGPAAGSTPSGTPIEELISRITQTLDDLTPEPLLSRLNPVVEDFMSQFQLVPARDFQAHLQALAQLEATVSELEQRIRALEQAEPPHS